MSSTDDPFGPNGRTVIRPGPAREPKAVPAGPGKASPLSGESPDSTVFDPGGAGGAPAGWGASGTVIYRGAAFGGDAAAFGPFGEPAPAVLAPRITAMTARKIPQDVLLEAGKTIEYPAANPLLAAAAPLLVFLSQLRLMPVEMEAGPLADHVAGLVREFERKVAGAGTSEEDARIARFALCETADDIIRNLPGIDREGWIERGMLVRFFQARAAGAGFFAALNKILAAPENHPDLLELMHACLSLGFEGQYRGAARGDGGLERVRQDVYETLRFFRTRADDDMSPRWHGLSAAAARTAPRLPLWSIAAATLALVTAAFFVMRTLVTNEGEALAGELLALAPSTPITIERADFGPLAPEPPVEQPVPAAAPPAQIDRIRAALSKEIEGGGLAVGTKGDFIVVEINNLLLFASGKADVKPEFGPVAADIAAALQAEPGQIRIVGHTDNIKPRKTSAFKSNYDLSVARAEAVKKAMAPQFSDPSRLTVEGKGEDEPIADNGTPDGRAKNRRVDVMIPRQETL
jgi:type VI secretion system protein ImpK